MANVVVTNAYQLNQHVIPLAQVTLVGFPTQGCLLTDCTNSPRRALGNGITVYTGIEIIGTGDIYYVQQTIATMATLFG